MRLAEVWVFALMTIWVVINSVLALGGLHRFDPFPYILLNLFLSMWPGCRFGVAHRSHRVPPSGAWPVIPVIEAVSLDER